MTTSVGDSANLENPGKTREELDSLIYLLGRALDADLWSDNRTKGWFEAAFNHHHDGTQLLRAYDGTDGQGPGSRPSRMRTFWADGDDDFTKGRMREYLNDWTDAQQPGSKPMAEPAWELTDATLQLLYKAWYASVKRTTMPSAVEQGLITKERLTEFGLSSMLTS